MTIQFTAPCPRCGRPSTYTATTDGTHSTITDVTHQETK